eukprot:201743-Chlamydomonas_euryale.AAC.2
MSTTGSGNHRAPASPHQPPNSQSSCEVTCVVWLRLNVYRSAICVRVWDEGVAGHSPETLSPDMLITSRIANTVSMQQNDPPKPQCLPAPNTAATRKPLPSPSLRR